jgi:hypothetical protein
MEGAESQGLEDEEIERALQEVGISRHGRFRVEETMSFDNRLEPLLSNVKVSS